MDAVKISTPKADSFRMPHVARLAKTPKENPVHAAAIETPPVHVPVSKEPGGKKGALRIPSTKSTQILLKDLIIPSFP